MIESTFWPKFAAVIFFGIASAFTFVNAQGDFESWTGLQQEFRLSDRLELNLVEEIRLNENFSEIDQLFGQLGAKLELSKSWDLGFAWRLGTKDASEKRRIRSRINLDLSYKTKMKRLSFKQRWRYQRRKNLLVKGNEFNYAAHGFRWKTSVSYNIRKWKLDPRFSAELFYRSQTGFLNGFRQMRYQIETDYKLAEKQKLSFGIALQNELTVWEPASSLIVNLGYIYKFDFRKKK